MKKDLPKDDLQKVVLRMLSAGLLIHLAHISSKNLPRHQALGSAYETLQEGADLLGEVTLGLEGSAILQEYSSFDAVSELNSCVDLLIELSKKVDDGPLKALVEDQVSKLRREVFLLQQT